MRTGFRGAERLTEHSGKLFPEYLQGFSYIDAQSSSVASLPTSVRRKGGRQKKKEEEEGETELIISSLLNYLGVFV